MLLVRVSRIAAEVSIDIELVTGPGATQFTVMFEDAASSATTRVRPIIPAFDEA
jgi:hypothetical protein